MTPQEFLSQGYLLERRVACDMRRAEAAREFARSIPSSCMDGDRVCTSRPMEAPFVRALEQADTLEKKAKAEMALLLSLKEQTERAISSVPGVESRMILTLRYMERKTFPEIAGLLHVSRNTARARHDWALSRMTMPDRPIDILHTAAVTAHI